MDSYIKNLVDKYMAVHRIDPILLGDNAEAGFMSLCTDDKLILQIFHNCQLFHESPCDNCEFRFKCYTI